MGIEVIDRELQNYEIKSIGDFYKLLAKFLCGKKVLLPPEECKDRTCFLRLNSVEKDLIQKLLDDNFELKNGLNFEQFNELLLLIKQTRVRKGFFDFFFESRSINTLEYLKKGISKFRLYAMLIYGNFRFAYKKLSAMCMENIRMEIGEYLKETPVLLKKLSSRPSSIINIEKIDKEYTFLLGYLSKERLRKETRYYENMVKPPDTELSTWFNKQYTEKEQDILDKIFLDLSEKMKKYISIGLINTNIYLTWDYMDIYIATSMRDEWEFQMTFETAKNIFNIEFDNGKHDNISLRDLKLRYFDPTQSYCQNRIDKGLVEALMLKRASLCVYMAQETDTMGKDSELASTLAQLKPVIAFIPDINVDHYKGKIFDYPLEYFHKRLKRIQSKRIFEKERVLNFLEDHKFIDFHAETRFLHDSNKKDIIKNLKEKGFRDFRKILDNFFRLINEYGLSQPFTFFKEREKIFKGNNSKVFTAICEILAVVEKYNFDARAELFKKYHPLAIQVDITKGVANGVFVVRNEKKCANLIYKILTNQLSFEIEHKEGLTILKEKETNSVYRVVTDAERLTNSFWNFYKS